MHPRILSASIIRPATTVFCQQQTCAFSISAVRREQGTLKQAQGQGQEKLSGDTIAKTPFRSARYLLEVAERQQQRDGGNRGGPRGQNATSAPKFGSDSAPENRRPNFKRPRQFSEKGSASSFSNRGNPTARFQAPPTIPYDISKELQFADNVDWEVSSVLESRPKYADVAAGRGTVAPLGTAAVNGSTYNPLLPGTAFSAHITGVRTYGDLDPEVEQALIQDLAAVAGDKSKDHRKKSDIPSVENQPFLFHMTHNYQEILNPRNAINRFNNGGVKHVAGIRYEGGSDEVQGATAGDQQAEKSWKRLERLGGDYSRSSSHLSSLTPRVGQEGRALLDNVAQLVGQNQSIGLEDKKKFLSAIEKGLGGY